MNSYAHLTSVTQTDTTSTCNNIADKHAPDRICFKKDDCRSRMPTESNSPSALLKTREFYGVLDGDAKFHSNELDEDVNLPHQSGPMLVETLNRFGLPSAYDSSAIQARLLLNRHRIAAINLGPTGQPRTNVISTIANTGLDLFILRQNHRAWTYYGHPFCQDENSKRAQIARIGQRSSFASGTRNGHGIIRCKMKQEGRRHG